MKQINFKRGQALLVSVIFFLILTMTIVFGIANPILNQVKTSRDYIKGKQSYILAEAGVEDVVYRLKKPITVASTETITLNGNTAQTSITTTSAGKTVTAQGNLGTYIRKVQAVLSTGTGVSFNYGVQSGNGGFNISGGSTVNGNVYANGNIVGNSATITGSAIAANGQALAADQTNNTPTTATTSISFHNTAATQDYAQSFQLTNDGPAYKVSFYMKKVGTPPDATVHLVADSSGSPGSTDLFTSSQTLQASQVTASNGWVTVVFSSNPQLTAGTKYWLVVDSASCTPSPTCYSSNYYVIAANNGVYGTGTAKTGVYGGSWSATSPASLDGYFTFYTGGLTSAIYGQDGSWDLTVGGDSWAHTVNNTSTTGTLYCQAGTGNASGKVCNTTKSDPAAQGYPLSDANIAQWKYDVTDAISSAGGWGYTGNLSLGSTGTSTATLHKITGNLTTSGGGTDTIGALEVTGDVNISGGSTLIVGPMKVDGNLNIGSTGLTLTGTVWVVGNVTVSGGAAVRLSSTYGSNSGILLSDGYMDLSGGANFYGSGSTGSYPMAVTTSSCTGGSTCSGHYAINASGGSGSVILNAQSGTLNFGGGTSAKSMAANLVNISGGGTITYDSGLANENFSSGPSGGYQISSWKEVQ